MERQRTRTLWYEIVLMGIVALPSFAARRVSDAELQTVVGSAGRWSCDTTTCGEHKQDCCLFENTKTVPPTPLPDCPKQMCTSMSHDCAAKELNDQYYKCKSDPNGAREACSNDEKSYWCIKYQCGNTFGDHCDCDTTVETTHDNGCDPSRG